MKGFGNSLVKSLGSVDLNLSLDEVKAIVSCKVVCDDLLEKPLIVGQTFSEQPHVIMYKDIDKLKFFNIDNEIPNPTEIENEKTVRVRILRHSELYEAASIKAATDSNFSGSMMLETKSIGKPSDKYTVNDGVYEVQNGLLTVTVTPYSIPCIVQENAISSRGTRVKVMNRILDTYTNDSDGIDNDSFDVSGVLLGDSDAESDKHNLFTILRRYRQCFANNLRDVQGTNVTEMHIELNSQRPVV